MSADELTKTEYDVLNAVVLKRMADGPAIARVTGVAPPDVEEALTALESRGLLVRVGGPALPTDDAEAVLAAVAAEHYAGVRNDPRTAEQVARFDTTNTQFLAAMTSWQQTDVGGRAVANDHSDAEYDEKVISRLEKLVTRLEPLLDALAAHDQRFGIYGRRFADAVDGVDTGRPELVASPTEDSIHTVWHEFHEDLLRTLGKDRSE
jgi:hypothetical protein